MSFMCTLSTFVKVVPRVPLDLARGFILFLCDINTSTRLWSPSLLAVSEDVSFVSRRSTMLHHLFTRILLSQSILATRSELLVRALATGRIVHELDDEQSDPECRCLQRHTRRPSCHKHAKPLRTHHTHCSRTHRLAGRRSQIGRASCRERV